MTESEICEIIRQMLRAWNSAPPAQLEDATLRARELAESAELRAGLEEG